MAVQETWPNLIFAQPHEQKSTDSKYREIRCNFV